MSEISWLGFGISSTVTRTFLHFMPQSLGVGAPYPVNLGITVGGGALPKRSVQIEGARLGHPDGFRLEEAIPAVRQQASGPYSVKIDISPVNQRVDLKASALIFELQYQQSSVRFSPSNGISFSSKNIGSPVLDGVAANSQSAQEEGVGSDSGTDALSSKTTAFALRDPSLYASVVLINSASCPVDAKIISVGLEEEVFSVRLEADAIKEFELPSLGLRNPTKLDCTWGGLEVELFKIDFQAAATLVSSATSAGPLPQVKSAGAGGLAAAYMIYRDRNSRRITSVVGL